MHGNAQRKETAPDGSKDENVFDIMQGVSITYLLRQVRKKKANLQKFSIMIYMGNAI